MRKAVLLLGSTFLWQLVCLGQTTTAEQKFADIFASVLIGEHPDTGNWEAPGTYLQASTDRPDPSAAAIAKTLQTPIDTYGLIIVPGFLSACADTISASASAFQQAEEHLRSKHGVDVTHMGVLDNTSEYNANYILTHLPKATKPNEKYILIGHSKGVPDLQTALLDKGLQDLAVALISVAGAIHGSPLVDLPRGRDLLSKVLFPRSA
jgi:hypothetical protein